MDFCIRPSFFLATLCIALIFMSGKDDGEFKREKWLAHREAGNRRSLTHSQGGSMDTASREQSSPTLANSPKFIMKDDIFYMRRWCSAPCCGSRTRCRTRRRSQW
ncbi:hypothetical protein VNO78_15875 [Psophocarpus tetragonolobus]|uniref:Secreted protein n=1 Tax=Psophocarpus tetragonolobus TaxID=3891 RepID=A0AAN9XK63_PSOTE